MAQPKVFYSKEQLSPLADDYLNVVLLPAISLLGILGNSVNMLVLAKLAFNEVIHLYMFINSVTNFLLMWMQFFVVIFRCGSLCSLSYTYESQVYELYINSYMSYSLVMFVGLNDIGVAIDRLLSFKVKYSKSALFNSKRNYLIRVGVLLVVSCAYVLPNYYPCKEIYPFGVLRRVYLNQTFNETLYSIRTTKEWQQTTLKAVSIFNSISRRAIIFIVLVTTNILILVKFRARVKTKRKLSLSSSISSNQNVHEIRSHEHTNRVALLVIAICGLYFFGNILDLTSSILDKILPSNQDSNGFHMKTFLLISNLFLLTSHAISIVIYYMFDVSYRIILHSMLHRAKRTLLRASRSIS